MNDMAPVIAPRSDQLTADDLLGGDRIITITGVKISPGADQPCEISFEGDNGKPWRPCRSMGRVMVRAWGADSKKYAGKSVQLYHDPEVLWAGMKVGGIRIRALSDISAPFDMALTVTRGKKAVSRFLPLEAPKQEDAAAKWAAGYMAAIAKADGADALTAVETKHAKALAKLENQRPELHAECTNALEAKRGTFGGDSWDDAESDGWEDDAPAFDPADLLEQIAAATNQAEWKAAKAAYEAAAIADDAVAAQIENALDTKRDALRSGQ